MAISTIVIIAGLGILRAEEAVKDADLGLSKKGVFETPTPQPFSYGKAFPGTSKTLPRAYPGVPPQIPHDIEMFTPVTRAKNACTACHDKPGMAGQKAPGAPTPMPASHYTDTPMPASHYTDLRRAPDKVTGKLTGARFVCTLCHVPQAGVKPLVGNTF
jgi:cytochrome c-type protein NapB